MFPPILYHKYLEGCTIHSGLSPLDNLSERQCAVDLSAGLRTRDSNEGFSESCERKIYASSSVVSREGHAAATLVWYCCARMRRGERRFRRQQKSGGQSSGLKRLRKGSSRFTLRTARLRASPERVWQHCERRIDFLQKAVFLFA